MAQDQAELMSALGFETFAVVGHDRGARVTRRMALDRPTMVSRLALLDIVPTATVYETIDMGHAATVWRYFFLIQPADLPERLIGADAGARIDCPVLVLWSRSGLGAGYDVLSVWREQAADVRGWALDCGHFLAEERPERTASDLIAFLSDV